jgi:hypothetical protein
MPKSVIQKAEKLREMAEKKQKSSKKQKNECPF